MKKAIVLSGIPGSGKSTYGKTLKFPYFSSDMIRLELFNTLRAHHAPEDDKRVFDRLHEIVFNYGDSLIYDATNIDRKKRMFLYEAFKKQGYQVEVHMLLEPMALAIYQNRKRDFERIVPDFVIIDMYQAMEPPRIGMDSDHIKIVTQSPFLRFKTSLRSFLHYAKKEGIMATIKHFISAAYLPELLKLENHPDIVLRIESAMRQVKDDALLLTTIFHDLGKGMTKEKDHFSNHDSVSSMYAFKFFNEIEDIPEDLPYEDIIDAILYHHQILKSKRVLKMVEEELSKNICTLIDKLIKLNN